MLPGVVDGDDVGVVERAGGLGLVLEAPQPLGVLGEVAVDDLERHLAREALVPGAIHLAHAALAEEAEHVVRPDPGSRGEARGRAHAAIAVLFVRLSSIDSDPAASLAQNLVAHRSGEVTYKSLTWRA